MLETLMKVIPPPLHPVETTGDMSWDEVEAVISTPLPADYKAFIGTYGTGIIGDFILIYNPFSQNKYLNLINRIQKELKDLRDMRRDMPNLWDYPYTIFPEDNGILLCGRTINGENIYWQTGGTPEQWTIALFHTRYSEHEEFPLPLTVYLEQLATTQISSTQFPSAGPFDFFRTHAQSEI